MDKRIEKIVINLESIDVISRIRVVNSIREVNSITQLSLETHDNEIKEIFEKYNLEILTNYLFDMKIVRALAENEEQLKDYLDVCRRANYSNVRAEIPDSIPEIEYDLRGLKNGFEKEVDEKLRTGKRIDAYEQAKKTQSIFKGAKKGVKIDIGMYDRAYIQVQKFLRSRTKTPVRALNSGTTTDEHKKFVAKYHVKSVGKDGIEQNAQKQVVEKQQNRVNEPGNKDEGIEVTQ